MLNKQSGQMYEWCSHTWNPIRGKCPHNCSYCYYQNNPRFKSKIGELRLDESVLKDDLGSNNFVFVGSSTDMFAEEVPEEWITKVLDRCKEFNNKYLFQTKNPKRFHIFQSQLPKTSTLGTTIETNRYYDFSEAPNRMQRMIWISTTNFDTMISIEPIMDFDLDLFVKWIKEINPMFVSIGADSKNHNLPEPNTYKINKLIEKLKAFTEVKIKENLKRLT